MASSPVLGMPGAITANDPTLKDDLAAAYEKGLPAANKYLESNYVPEISTNPHPRMISIAASVKERRGKKVDIQFPLYQDENTDMKASTPLEPHPGMVHMDSMHFGMGCCCLQITYETININHSRYLYDMFIPFTPILSALSQSAPIFKGKLTEYDFRWESIELATDCRTDNERNQNHPDFIHKPRYSPVSHYLSNHKYVLDEHNDTLPFRICPLIK